MLHEGDPDSVRPRLQLVLGDELREVLDLSPIATSISRVSDGIALYANPACLALIEHDASQVIGRSSEELALWALPDSRQAVVDRLIHDGIVRDHELQLVTGRGGHRTVIASVFLVELGGESCLLSMFYDITARAQLEAALRETRDRFEDLARSVDDVFAVLGLDPRTYLYISPAVESVFGVTPEQVRADPDLLIRMVHPDDRQLVESSYLPAALSGRPTEIENRVVRPDGQVRWVWLRIWPILEEDGTFDRLALLFRDVTSRALLAQEQQRMTEAALESSRSKSEFLAAMSHEIRTPLNGVIGMAGLLQQTALSDEQRQYVEIARASGEALLAIIDDILDFSKIEAGRLDLEQVPFDLGELVSSVMDVVQTSASAKDLETRVTLDPALPPQLLGDPVRLRQVLLNLLGNAAKFTEEGYVWLRIAPEGDLLRFEVEDTGIGIPPDVLTSIFDSFTQADRTTTRRYGGTGLGLAICRRLTEMMGGRIGCTSRPGEGSTFWFTADLPAAPHAQEAEAEQAEPAATTTPALDDAPRRGHLLVVDDNATNRLVAEAMLRRRGYTVECAVNGVEAVEAVARSHYDAVLMDCEMPVLDGYAATRQIREAEGSTRHTTIIALTAAAMQGDAERALAAGMDAHVTKPITFDQLHSELDRLLRSGGSVQQPARGQDSTLDAEPLEMLLRLDPGGDLLRRIVDVFVKEGPTYTEDLRRAHTEGDLDGVGRASHGLCGMSCAVGAVKVTEQCRAIESLTRQGALPAGTVLEDLTAELARATDALTAFTERSLLAPR